MVTKSKERGVTRVYEPKVGDEHTFSEEVFKDRKGKHSYVVTSIDGQMVTMADSRKRDEWIWDINFRGLRGMIAAQKKFSSKIKDIMESKK